MPETRSSICTLVDYSNRILPAGKDAGPVVRRGDSHSRHCFRERKRDGTAATNCRHFISGRRTRLEETLHDVQQSACAILPYLRFRSA